MHYPHNKRIYISLDYLGFPGGANGKELTCQSKRYTHAIPGLGRSPGGGHGDPLQYSCLENPMDRGTWHATVRRVAKSQIITEAI